MVGPVELHLGVVDVSQRVVGSWRRHALTGTCLSGELLDLPASGLVSQASWYVVDPGVLRGPGMPAPATSGTNMVVYDGYPVNASIACAAGCPSCVQSPKGGHGSAPLDKAGAVALLRSVLGRAQEGPGEPPPARRAVGTLRDRRVKRGVSPWRRPPRPPCSLVSTRSAG